MQREQRIREITLLQSRIAHATKELETNNQLETERVAIELELRRKCVRLRNEFIFGIPSRRVLLAYVWDMITTKWYWRQRAALFPHRMREDEYEDSIVDVQLRQIELDVCVFGFIFFPLRKLLWLPVISYT